MRRFAFHRWTLGAKLAATFATVISFVVLVVSLWVVARSRSALEHELADRGADAARNLSRLSAELVLEEDSWGLYKVVRDVVGADGDGLVAYAAIVDAHGFVLAHSDPARHPMGEPLGEPGVNSSERDPPGGATSVPPAREEAVRHFTAPIVVDHQQVATARIGISLRKLEATISRISTEIVGLGVLLQWFGLLLGYVISRRMTRPLTELRLAAERITAGQLDPPAVTTKEKDEIGALADRFNLMAIHLRDSQRKTEEAHAQLVRSERLATIGECAGALAHEIRNPLGGVVAAARMLSSRAPEAVTYDRERLAGVIADEARRLNVILSEFLVFAGHQPPSRKPHSMSALVGEVLDLLRLDELARGKALDRIIGPENGPCDMDRDQMKQVLWNLLRNALEATPQGARVSVRTIQGDDAVAVEIVDQGVGITPDRQRRLFEPFQTTKSGGTGLGLAIAHRIVTAHGGNIDVASRAGEGTRMCVTLPLHAPVSARKDEAA